MQEEAMTDIKKINREFAEKVMGWIPNEDGDWDLPDGEWCGFYEDEWDPYHRIDHAWMGLEKFEYWKLERVDNEYECRIIIVGRVYKNTYWQDTAPAAICLACLEAVKK
jgi:hypothetical protein